MNTPDEHGNCSVGTKWKVQELTLTLHHRVRGTGAGIQFMLLMRSKISFDRPPAPWASAVPETVISLGPRHRLRGEGSNQKTAVQIARTHNSRKVRRTHATTRAPVPRNPQQPAMRSTMCTVESL